MNHAHEHHDQAFDMDALVGYALLGGVLLSVALIVIGLIWNTIEVGSLNVNYLIRGTNLAEFAGATIHQVTSGQMRPHTILNLGICVLLLTPFVRVLASVFYFAVQRNWKYTIFTGFVLAVLTYSLMLR